MPRSIPIPVYALASILLVWPNSACRTETTTSPPVHETEIAYATLEQIWEVREGSQLLGFVVRFGEPEQEEQGFFSVRNPNHQELGMIDWQGRSYRYHAHEPDPTWLGTGTIKEGVRRILDAGGGLELVEKGPAKGPSPAGE